MRIVPARTKTVVPALLVRLTVVFALVGSMISFTVNSANGSPMQSDGYYDCNSGTKVEPPVDETDLMANQAATPDGTYLVWDLGLYSGSFCTGHVVVSPVVANISSTAFNNNSFITSISIPANTRVNSVEGDAPFRAFAGTDSLTTFYYCSEWPIANTGLDVVGKTRITCPSAPTIIQAFSIGNTYINFRPSSSDGGSPTMTYTVTAHPLGGVSFEANVGDVYNFSDGLSDITQYEILGLSPETTYTFSISAHNGYFDSSNSSRSVQVKTAPGDGWYLCSDGAYNPVQADHLLSYRIDRGVVVESNNCEGAVAIRPGTLAIEEGFIESSITSVTIPESVQYLERAFQDSAQLSQVTFLDNSNLVEIGSRSFQGTNIETIAIPSSVEEIGQSSFEGTDLSSITIPRSVTDIREFAFRDSTQLAQINFDNNSRLEKIEYGAFRGTGLNSISIPAGVSRIERGAFIGTTSLSNIEVDNANETFRSVDGVLFRVYEDELYELYKYPQAKLGSSYIIPDGLEIISTDAFAGTRLRFINIPSTVHSIGYEAFKDTDLVAYNFCINDVTVLTDTSLVPERKVCTAAPISQENLYRNWQTPLAAITNGPTVGETVNASAFERVLSRDLLNPEYRVNTSLDRTIEDSYPTPEEYVYRITRYPNSPATSVDHQPHTSYESLSDTKQAEWYTELGFTDVNPYQFIWMAFLCVNQDDYSLSRPTGLNSSYASRDDGILNDGSFNRAHNFMFYDAIVDWDQAANQGQTVRSAVGSYWGGGDLISRAFQGDSHPVWRSHMWGFSDVGGSCQDDADFRALTIRDSAGSSITTKSFNIPENLYFDLGDVNLAQVSSAGVTIGVTGGASIRAFNAALWGLTTIADSNATTPPTQGPTTPPTTPPTTTQAPTTTAAISPVLTNKSTKLKVSFSARSSKLSAKEKKKLLRVVANVGSKVTGGKVIGYVQLDGNSSNDRKLSTARARAVSKFLADNGIKVRIVTKGKGALNNKESSRRANITLRYAE